MDDPSILCSAVFHAPAWIQYCSLFGVVCIALVTYYVGHKKGVETGSSAMKDEMQVKILKEAIKKKSEGDTNDGT